jgi:serine/threonine protein kinase
MNLVSECFCVNCGAANASANTRCSVCGQSLKTTQPLPSALSVPLLKERYHLLELVGEGGFSTVHRAEDTQTRQLVAIKATSLRGLSSQEKIEATDAFNREVCLLSQVSQRHLPRVYDHFSDAECWYLVMEFIDGITLEKYLEQQGASALPLEEVLDLGLLLCDVLAYLHSRQPAIIFRDLKPSNIMLTRDGHLFLIDFGIARRFTPGKAKDTIPFGSPGYAAPEQYGHAQTCARSDIYSLGAILHQLLSGHDPAQTPFAFLPLPQQDRPELVQLNGLIQQMVALDDDQRPESMQVVKRELEQIALQHRRFRGLSSSTPHWRAPYSPIYLSPTGTLTTSSTQVQAQVISSSSSQQNQYYPTPRRNYFAIAGLVSGLCCPFYPFVVMPLLSIYTWPILNLAVCFMAPILTIILSAIGLYREKTAPGPIAKDAISAWPGLILGIFFLLLYLCVLASAMSLVMPLG